MQNITGWVGIESFATCCVLRESLCCYYVQSNKQSNKQSTGYNPYGSRQQSKKQNIHILSEKVWANSHLQVYTTSLLFCINSGYVLTKTGNSFSSLNLSPTAIRRLLLYPTELRTHQFFYLLLLIQLRLFFACGSTSKWYPCANYSKPSFVPLQTFFKPSSNLLACFLRASRPCFARSTARESEYLTC